MKIGDLVTIDENTYVVFSNCRFNNTEFYYLTNGKQKNTAFLITKKQ